MTVATLLQQQQITASPVHQTIALPAATHAQPISTENSQDLHVRLRKRHSNWHEQYEREMSSQEIEWANPCGGEWHQNLTALPVQPHRTPVKKILRMLQNSTGKEQKTIKVITPVINISDMRMWSLHKDAYKFLPVLKINSNVALRRWHRQLQLYVASFAYLRRAQMKWDHFKLQRESNVSKELLKLKQSARSILCEIETAINNTSSQLSAATHKRALRLTFLSRDAVEKRLRFQSNLKQLYDAPNAHHQRHQQQHAAAEVQEVNPVDLKFAKYRYFSYIRAILKIMRTHTRRAGEVNLDSRSASSAAAATSKQLDPSSLMNSSLDQSAATSNSLELMSNQSQQKISNNKKHKVGRQRQQQNRNSNSSKLAADLSSNTSRATANSSSNSSRRSKKQQRQQKAIQG